MAVDLMAGLVRIFRPDGATAGTGFLVDETGLIVTCSHVVQDHEEQGREPRPEEVKVVFGGGGAQRNQRIARVIPEWWSGFEAYDVAFLQCEGALPERTKPLPLGFSSGTEGRKFKTFGFPQVNSVWGVAGKGEVGDLTRIDLGGADFSRPVLQINSNEVTNGFSGAPILDVRSARVIGMASAIAPEDEAGKLGDTAFITPAETLKDICPRLQLGELRPFDYLEWPSGFTELEGRAPSGFRAFLHGDRLPYLARDSWRPPSGLKQQWTESSLVEELSETQAQGPEARQLVVVLTGPGGVGKTRLGLEIARRMRDKGWWPIRCDGTRARTEGLKQLLSESPHSTRVVLFMDYLEASPASFEALVNEIDDLDELSRRQVRLIATCRASFRYRLRPSTKIKRVYVGGADEFEIGYSNAVTQHILSSLGTTDLETLARKCRHNFALAAFLLFLKQNTPDKFESEVSALRQEPRFEEWIVGRLWNAGVDIFVAAAMLAACEFSDTIFDGLAKAHGADASQLRRVLGDDKWIERREPAEPRPNGPVWAAFHDSFADVVLKRALDTAQNQLVAIDQLLQRAVDHGVLEQTLKAFGRLEKPMLAPIDWLPRLEELELRKPGALAAHARELLTLDWLGPRTLVGLLSDFETLRETIASDPAHDVGLALIAAAWSNADATESQQSEFNLVFLPLLDAAVARHQESNIVLRLGFEGRPDRYREAARQWIDGHRRLFQTHFLLNAWLEGVVDELRGGNSAAAGHIEAVRDAVGEWLSASLTLLSASFVLAPWLNAAAEIRGEQALSMASMVEDHVAAWLNNGDHAICDEAQFVYTGWLNAAAAVGGDRAHEMVVKVQGHIDDWLAHDGHAVRDAAKFTYTSWLNAAASIGRDRAHDMVARIQGSVASWLAHDHHYDSDDARYVYTSWLNAAAKIGGARAAGMAATIEDEVVAWLARGDNAVGDNAGFVYSSWLEAAAAIRGPLAAEMAKTIEKQMIAWLARDDHFLGEDAKYVYSSWLKAAAATGRETAATMVEKIESQVDAWLASGGHAGGPDARLVYSSWLEAAPVRKRRRFYDQTLEWILAHQDDERCSYLLESWLDKQLEFEPVSEACFRAVHRLYREPNGAFILKHVVRQKKLPATTIVEALSWCNRFPDHMDALNRLGPLLRVDWAKQFGAAPFVRVAAKVLFHQNIDAAVSDGLKLVVMRATIGSLFAIGAFFPTAEMLARIYFVRWLRDGRVFRPATPCGRPARSTPIFDQRLPLGRALLTLLARGEFTPKTNNDDETVIAQFCDWVGTWATPNRDQVRELIENLTARFGLRPLWERMLPAKSPEGG
jgi:hypothetical protein